jgi:CRP/FNR family cyclic AMP-dependent transcriptional regulator
MEWMGYLAAVLVFGTFAMRTMLPLRWMAIASNGAFLGYAIPLHLWPIAVLHGLLLPLNIARLIQIKRMLTRLRTAQTHDIDVRHFMAQLKLRQHSPGMVLFNKGDKADGAYYIVSGEVEIPERGVRLGPGQFFGEIGVFASSRVRTGSAHCVSAVTLYRIDESDLIAAFYQSPTLAFTLVRLIVDRMGENLVQMEQAKPAPTGGTR